MAVSMILYVVGASDRVRLVRLSFPDAAQFAVEPEPPPTVGAGECVVLTIYGSLFFASAPVFVQQLPDIDAGAAGSAVVLVLRGHDDLGSTFIQALGRFHDELRAADAHLLLAGMEPPALTQLTDTGMLHRLGTANVLAARPTLGEAMHQAIQRVETLRESAG